SRTQRTRRQGVTAPLRISRLSSNGSGAAVLATLGAGLPLPNFFLVMPVGAVLAGGGVGAGVGGEGGAIAGMGAGSGGGAAAGAGACQTVRRHTKISPASITNSTDHVQACVDRDIIGSKIAGYTSSPSMLPMLLAMYRK